MTLRPQPVTVSEQEIAEESPEITRDVAIRTAWKRKRKWAILGKIREAYEPVHERLRKALTADPDIAKRTTFAAMVMEFIMASEDQRAIVKLLEMLRRTYGHDAATVKHEVSVPTIDKVLAWKKEIMETVGAFEIVDGQVVERVKRIEAVVVADRDDATKQSNG